MRFTLTSTYRPGSESNKCYRKSYSHTIEIEYDQIAKKPNLNQLAEGDDD